jgi:cysteinyl-tRNA synthetase
VLRIHDTLRGEKVPFEPRDPGRVTAYWCGPTVYDAPHLGHARSALAYDVVVRYLRWRGYEVTLASNVTDIDDKIIERAAAGGTTESELARRYEDVYVEQMDRLGVLRPDLRPRATEFVTPMVRVIGELIDAGMAYVIERSGVYFDVSRLEGYGDLVHRHPDDLREGAGARVDVDERKDDPLDFALWKAAKPGEPSWDSPWGPGRPGWHIECVAMSLDLLGEGFDIHGGGDDLVFPHHTNERAEALGCGRAFARYWVHNGMVNVEGEKMSKSLGNFTTLADVLDRWDPRALRLLVLQTHYRKTMEIDADTLASATAALERLDALARRTAGSEPTGTDPALVEAFREAMDDDFGTAAGLAVVFEGVRRANRALDAGSDDGAALAATVVELAGVLGLELGGTEAPAGTDDAEIDALVAERTAARAARDFARADAIRDELASRKVTVEDTPQGPVWRRA